MFTGIITDLGRVARLEPAGDLTLVIETAYPTASIAIGASIACSGCCLTVTDHAPGRFSASVSAETLSKTTLGDWRVGTPVNLERPLRAGDELGGHIVAGHVDGVALILERRPDGASVRFLVEAPQRLAFLVASKGSVALDGVSLTVNEVSGNRFGVNLIPHSLAVTSFGTAIVGQRVNLEIDLLARYVQRLMEGRDS
jgi:riboflavin synthase